LPNYFLLFLKKTVRENRKWRQSRKCKRVTTHVLRPFSLFFIPNVFHFIFSIPRFPLSNPNFFLLFLFFSLSRIRNRRSPNQDPGTVSFSFHIASYYCFHVAFILFFIFIFVFYLLQRVLRLLAFSY
jgi:hypothetical protein